MKETDQFYFSQDEPNKSCLLALRSIILGYDVQMNETKKYGMPCFCYGNKACCYLWTDKKSGHPYVLMVEGNLLHHPNLEAGNRARMKVLPIDPQQDIPMGVLSEVLDEALELYKNGTIKVKLKA